MTERTCGSCSETLPIEKFDLDRQGRDGRRGQCKACRSAKMKAWYAANRERQAQRQAERFVKNRDAIRQQDRERYYRNKDARIQLVIDNEQRRRAIKQGVAAEKGITVAELRKRHGDICPYCSQVMVFKRAIGRVFIPLKATVEHVVPLSKGGPHTWENVVLACWQCNVRKNDSDLESWTGSAPSHQGL